ncbi:MAG: ribosomal protein S18-alanine N-acetyltransferase [Endozoicomonas sp.]
MPKLNFRAMTVSDLEQIHRIEQSSAEHPWKKSHFADSIKSGYFCCIAERRGKPVGHTVVMTVANEASLLILTVDKQHQRQGIGRQLLRHLISTVQLKGCDTFLLEVRQSNARAFQLYLEEGFCEIEVRKKYYPMGNTREDAIVMAMDLDSHHH